MNVAIVLIFIGFIFSAFQFTSVGTYAVSLIDIGVISFFLVVLKRLLWDGEAITIRRSFAMFLLLAFLAFAILSGFYPLFSSDPQVLQQYFKTFIHFIYVWFIAFFAISMDIPLKSWIIGLKAWLILSIPVNIFAAYQIVARAFDLPFAWLTIFNFVQDGRGFEAPTEMTQLSLSFEGFFRATSVFSEPSALALFNVLVLAAILAPYIRNTAPFISSAFLRRIIVVCSTVGLFLTFSLTGLSTIVGIIVAAFIFERNSRLIKLLKNITILAAILFITDIAVEYYADISVTSLFLQRVGGIVSVFSGGSTEMTTGESFFTRANTMQKCVEIWTHYPLTGIGLGCYYSYTKSAEMAFADSTLFQALSDTGLGGFLTIAALSISSILIPLQPRFVQKFLGPAAAKHNNDGDLSSCREFSIYAGIIMMINLFIGNSLVGVYLWLIWGMIFSISQNYSPHGGLRFAIRHPLSVFFIFSKTLQITS